MAPSLVDKQGRSFAGLIQHQTAAPAKLEPVDPPVPARCTARAYDGTVVAVDGLVTVRSGQWVAFEAEYDGSGSWIAVVDRTCCQPLVRPAANGPTT